MWVEFGVSWGLSRSRSPTSGQTVLESTLKSPAVSLGPGWWRGRGHKNNPPHWFVYTPRQAYFPELRLHSENFLCFSSLVCTKNQTEGTMFNVPFVLLTSNIYIYISSYGSVSGFWSKTKKALASGDTCGVLLSKDIFHDRWVARSTALTGTQLRFIFNSGSVCGKVWRGGRSVFQVPGMKLTLHLQYEGMALIQPGSTKGSIHNYHHPWVTCPLFINLLRVRTIQCQRFHHTSSLIHEVILQ